MSKKQIYIHIGMPRAGSTFLQEFVFPNLHSSKIYSQPQLLKDKVIPQFIRKIWLKGYYTKQELEKFQNDFWKVINEIDQNKILISQEGLGGFDFQAGRGNLEVILKALHATVPNAKIIIVLRNQLGWLKSLYYLAIKGGHFTNFTNFITDNNNYWNVKLEEINHEEIFTKIRKYFKEVYAIRFELIKEDFPEYLKIFENIMNAEISTKINNKPINIALSETQMYTIGKLGSWLKYDKFWNEKYTFITRSFNTSLRSKGKILTKCKFLFYYSLRNIIYYAGFYYGKLRKPKSLISNDQKSFLENKFYLSNQAFWNSKNIKEFKNE